MGKEARVWLFMIVALAASVAASMSCTSLLRGRVPLHVETAAMVFAGLAAYVAVSRALMGPPR